MDEYFDTETEPTVCGLALHLGFVSRQSFLDYRERGGFSDIIKKAKLRIEQRYEELLTTRGVNPAGPIFVLKNMNWSDKQDYEVRGTVEHRIVMFGANGQGNGK